MPTYIDAGDLLTACLERKVAFVPGEPFHPDGGGKNTMRINFSNATHEEIQEGISRIGSTIDEKMGRQVTL
jgi:DNA-binding transcriptional MocR family regulator